MYEYNFYLAFVQLRKQYYKIKTRKQLDKYSKIESYKKEYKTFKRFCLYCDDFVYTMNNDKTTQEVFEELLELSQKRILKFYII